MQNQYLIWVAVVAFISFIIYRRFFTNPQKDFNRAIKAKSRLSKQLMKQGKRDNDLKNCLYGVEIRKLTDLDQGEDDKDVYCLVVIWKRHRDFCVDIPELLQGFRVFERVLGKDHNPEPCPLPEAVCAGCGCDNKSDNHPRLPDNPPPDFFDNISTEDPSSQEAGSIG